MLFDRAAGEYPLSGGEARGGWAQPLPSPKPLQGVSAGDLSDLTCRRFDVREPHIRLFIRE